MIATDQASFGSVLFDRPLANPRSRRKRRWDIHDGLASVDELLGQQVTQAAGALDCPHPFSERPRPRQQPFGLGACRSHRDPIDLGLVVVDRYCLVGRVVRVDTDHLHESSSGFLR